MMINNSTNSSNDDTIVIESTKKSAILNGSPETSKKEYGSLKGSYKVIARYNVSI